MNKNKVLSAEMERTVQRKNLYAVLLCIVAVLLVSCSKPYSFSQDLNDFNSINIEIVNIECEMGYHLGTAYNEENIEVISVIENGEKETFLSDFKKIKSYQPNFGSRIDCVYGEAIRLTYPDEEIELITSYGTAVITNGYIRVYTTTFESEGFDALIEKYSKKTD